MKNKLLDKTDQDFFSFLDTYLFQKRPLNEIINQYKKEPRDIPDSDGKDFYGVLLNEIRSMRKDREDLVDIVNRFIQQNDPTKIEELEKFFRAKILN